MAQYHDCKETEENFNITKLACAVVQETESL